MASLVVQLIKNPPAMQVDFWVRKICWRRDRLPTPAFLGFPCGLAAKESTYNVGDLALIPGLGRSLGEGIRLQYGRPGFDPWVGQICNHLLMST